MTAAAHAGPFAIPAEGWRSALVKAWQRSSADNISLLAAGVAFFGFLAMVPLLAAVVLSYGLIASPATVVDNMHSLTRVMPAEAARLIGDQLANVVHASGGKKGLGLLLALGIALYGAMSGAGAVVTALNIAYEAEDRRGFVALNLVTLAITFGAVMLAVVATVAVAALGHLDALIPQSSPVAIALGKVLSYLVTLAAGAGAAALLYRYGPDRREARWVWLTPGSVGSASLWLLLTLGFGIYVANFGKYDATYGSLGAVVVLLTWIYLSAYILLMGAELNAGLERTATPTPTDGGDDAHPAPGAIPARQATLPVRPALPSRPGYGRVFAVSRMTARAGRWAGFDRPGLLPTTIATGGLVLIGRRGRAAAGLALVGLGAALAWLQRSGDRGN